MTIKVNKLFLGFLLILFFIYTPTSLFYFGLPQIFKVIKYLILVITICLFLIKTKKFDSFFLLSLIFNLLILFTTILNKSNIIGSIQMLLNNVGSVCLYTLILRSKNKRVYIKAICLYFTICTTICTAFLVIYPQGMYTPSTVDGINSATTFLGIDNPAVVTYLLALFFSAIGYSEKTYKFSFYIYNYALLCIFSINRSVGSGIAISAFVGIMLLFRQGKKSNKNISWTGKGFVMFYLVANFLIAIGHTQFAVTDYITKLIGKSSNFSGRTIVWQYFISAIIKKPIIGYGLQYGSNYDELTYSNSLYAYVSSGNTHNLIMQVCYISGMIGIILFLLLLFMSVKRFNFNINNEKKYYIIIVFVAFLIRSLVEIGIESSFIMLPFLFYSSDEISQSN